MMPRSKQEAQRRKRRVHMKKEAPFPIPIASTSGEAANATTWFYYTGYLEGSAVVVKHSGDMDFLYKMGFFGKGTLSRSQPNFEERRQKVNLRVDGTDTQPAQTLQCAVMSKRNYLTHRRYRALSDGNSDEYSDVVRHEEDQQGLEDSSEEAGEDSSEDENMEEEDINIAKFQAFRLLNSQNSRDPDRGLQELSGLDCPSLDWTDQPYISRYVKPYLVSLLAEVSVLSNEQITTFLRVPQELRQLENKYRVMRMAELNMLKQMFAVQFPGRNFREGEVITLDEDESSKNDVENDADDAVVVLDSDDEDSEEDMEKAEPVTSKVKNGGWDDFAEGDTEFWGAGDESADKNQGSKDNDKNSDDTVKASKKTVKMDWDTDGQNQGDRSDEKTGSSVNSTSTPTDVRKLENKNEDQQIPEKETVNNSGIRSPIGDDEKDAGKQHLDCAESMLSLQGNNKDEKTEQVAAKNGQGLSVLEERQPGEAVVLGSGENSGDHGTTGSENQSSREHTQKSANGHSETQDSGDGHSQTEDSNSGHSQTQDDSSRHSQTKDNNSGDLRSQNDSSRHLEKNAESSAHGETKIQCNVLPDLENVSDSGIKNVEGENNQASVDNSKCDASQSSSVTESTLTSEKIRLESEDKDNECGVNFGSAVGGTGIKENASQTPSGNVAGNCPPGDNDTKMSDSDTSSDSDDVICIESESAKPKTLHNFLSQSPKASSFARPVVTRSVTFMSNISREPTYVSATVGFTSWDSVVHFNFTGDPSHLPTAMAVPSLPQGQAGSLSDEPESTSVVYERVYPPILSLLPNPNSQGAVIKQRVKGLPCLSSAYMKVSSRAHSSSGSLTQHRQNGTTTYTSANKHLATKFKLSQKPLMHATTSQQSAASSSSSLRSSTKTQSGHQIPPSTTSSPPHISPSHVVTYMKVYGIQPCTDLSGQTEPKPSQHDVEAENLPDTSAKQASLSETLRKLSQHVESSIHYSKSLTSQDTRDKINFMGSLDSLLLEYHVTLSQYLSYVDISTTMELSILKLVLSKSELSHCSLHDKIREVKKDLTAFQSWILGERLDHLEERQKMLNNSVNGEDDVVDLTDSADTSGGVHHQKLSQDKSNRSPASSECETKDGQLQENGHVVNTDTKEHVELMSIETTKDRSETKTDSSDTQTDRTINLQAGKDDINKKKDTRKRKTDKSDDRGEESKRLKGDDGDGSVNVTLSGKEEVSKVDGVTEKPSLPSKCSAERDADAKHEIGDTQDEQSVAETSVSTVSQSDSGKPNSDSGPSVHSSGDNVQNGRLNGHLSYHAPTSAQSDCPSITSTTTSQDVSIGSVSDNKVTPNSEISDSASVKQSVCVSEPVPHEDIDSIKKVADSCTPELETTGVANTSKCDKSAKKDQPTDKESLGSMNHMGDDDDEDMEEVEQSPFKEQEKQDLGSTKSSQSESDQKSETLHPKAGTSEDFQICIGSSSEEEDVGRSGRDTRKHRSQFPLSATAENIHPYSTEDDVDGGVLVVANTSDDDDDDDGDHDLWLNKKRQHKWRPCLKKDPCPVQEKLHLMLEEAFFLSFGLGCLQVVDPEMKTLDISQMWQKFQELKEKFVPHYVAYHYFRSQGWVPKSGLKFGCDLVLYREGPPFFHGSYSVVVLPVNDQTFMSSHRNFNLNHRQLSWISLAGLKRITEHVAKELMICYVLWPAGLTKKEILSPNCISKFRVKEVVVSRWTSNRERQTKPEEEEMP